MKRIICIIFVCLLMFGCSDEKLNKKMFKKHVPQETEQLAAKCVKFVRERKLKQASNLFVRQYRTKQTVDSLNKISKLMNSGTLKSQELVGWNAVNWSTVNLSGNVGYSKKTVLEYQQDLSGKWLLLTITIFDDKFVAGINAIPLNKPLQEINAFSINKPFSQILFLILPILILLFSLYTLVVCCITKLKKRKWLWIIFILLGVGRITMNWTLGQFFWKLTCIQLLIPGIFRQGIYGPWMISTSIPLGAILFWIFKKKITKTSDDSGSATPDKEKELTGGLDKK